MVNVESKENIKLKVGNDAGLIVMTCRGCDKTFKVMKNSKQKYHSKDCENVSTSRDTSKDVIRLPTRAEAFYILTGVRPQDGKNFSIMKYIETLKRGKK